jgi:hypothetical protein
MEAQLAEGGADTQRGGLLEIRRPPPRAIPRAAGAGARPRAPAGAAAAAGGGFILSGAELTAAAEASAADDVRRLLARGSGGCDPEEEEEEEEEEEGKGAAVALQRPQQGPAWAPPRGQTGDGRTSLNAVMRY